MAIDQTLQINYLIKAVDEATSTLKRIDQETKKTELAVKELEKANKDLSKSQELVSFSMMGTIDKMKSIIEKYGEFNRVLASLDFKQVANALNFFAELLRLKNADIAAKALDNIALKLRILGPLINSTAQRIVNLQDSFGNALGSIVGLPEWMNLYNKTNLIISVLKKLGLAIVVFESFRRYGDLLGFFVDSLTVLKDLLINSASYVSQFNNIFGTIGKNVLSNKESIDRFVLSTQYGFHNIENSVTNAKKSFFSFVTDNNRISNIFTTSIDNLRNKILGVGESAAKSGGIFSIFGKTIKDNEVSINRFADSSINSVNKVNNSINTARKFTGDFNADIKDLGKSIYSATMHAEVFEGGLFGFTTRLTTLASVFSILGINLVQADSMMAKMAGTTLLILTAALGGVALVIKQILNALGGLIISLGSSLVKSMQTASETMKEQQKQTFAFKFVIDSMNRSVGESVGTFETWNNVIREFSKDTGFAIGETQVAVNELLMMGQSLGLNRVQMEKLLPVIGDLAIAQHRDLYTTTLAITEAIGGQTQMLKNMGVDVSEAGIKHSKFGNELKKGIDKLDQHTQAILRYNTILSKTSYLTDLASESINTISGANRKYASEMQNINAIIGEGANLIETQYKVSLAGMVTVLRELSPEALKAVGFFTALAGRSLELIGTITQLSFSIVFLTSVIASLNELLKSKVIGNWIVKLGQAEIFTKANNTAFGILVRTIGEGLLKIGEGTLKFSSIWQLLTKLFLGLGKAAIALLIPFGKVVAVVGIISVAFYALYDAIVRIEQETKIFTGTWAALVEWFKSSSMFDPLIKGLDKLREGLIYLYKFIVDVFATSVIWLINLFIELRIKFIEIFSIIKIYWDSLATSISENYDKIIKKYNELLERFKNTEVYKILNSIIDNLIGAFQYLMEKVGEAFDFIGLKFQGLKDLITNPVKTIKDGFLSLIGVQSAYAADVNVMYDEILKVINAHGQLSKSQIAYVLGLKDASEVSDKFAKTLKETNYQMIQEQIASERANDIITSISKSKKTLNAQDRESIAIAQKSIKANDEALTRLRNKLYLEKTITKEVEKSTHAEVKRSITQGDVLNKINEVLKKIKLGTQEQIIFNFSIDSVKTALGQVTSKIDEIKNKLKDAKEEDLTKFIGELNKLQNEAIKIEMIGSVSGLVGLGAKFAEGALPLLKAGAVAIGTAIGGPLGGMIGEVIGQALDVLSKSPDEFRKMLMKTFEDLPIIIRNVIDNLMLVAPDVIEKGLVVLIDALPSIIEKVVEAVATMYLNPVFWSKIAFNVAWAFIKAIPEMVAAIARGFRDAFYRLGDNYSKATDAFTKAIKDLKAWWRSIDWSKTWGNIGQVLYDAVYYALAGALAPFIAIYYVFDYAVKNFSKVVDFFASIVRFFGKGIDSFLKFIVNLPADIVRAFFSGVDALIGIVSEFASMIWEAIKSIPQFFADFIVSLYNLFVGLTKMIYDIFASIGKIVFDSFSAIYAFFTKDFVNFIKDFFKNIGKFAKEAFQFIFNELPDFLMKVLKPLINLFESVGSVIIKAGKSFIDGIIKGAGSFINELVKGVGRVFKGVGGGVGGVISEIPIVGDVVSGVVGAVGGALGGLFEMGGIPALRAAQGLLVGGNSTQGDRVPVRVNSREMILSLDQQARLFKLLQGELSSNMNQRPLEIHTTVELDSRTLGKTIDKLDANGWRR
jgi:phage-related protein